MTFTIRALTESERKYSYAQSKEEQKRMGSIGRLRGDFGTSGYEFHSTWEDHNEEWKSGEFKTEFDAIINALRFDDYGLLKNRVVMRKYAENFPNCAFEGNYTTEYGFRVDTEQYSYLFRCIPVKGDYNFYCFCYVGEMFRKDIQ